jgi:hypothetical protein
MRRRIKLTNRMRTVVTLILGSYALGLVTGVVWRSSPDPAQPKPSAAARTEASDRLTARLPTAIPPTRSEVRAPPSATSDEGTAGEVPSGAEFRATITGRVVNALHEPEPGAGVQAIMVEADRNALLAAWGENESESLNGPPFLARTRSRSDGSFILRGLQPGSNYQVSVSGAPSSLVVLHYSCEAMSVIAPCSDVELATSRHEIDLEIMAPVEATPEAKATCFELHTYVGPQPVLGGRTIPARCRLSVAPDQHYALEVKGAGLRPVRVPDVVLAASEPSKHVVVPMQAWSGNRILLDVVSDHDEALKAVTFVDVTSWGIEGGPVLNEDVSGITLSSRHEGEFHVLENLEPGVRRLAVLSQVVDLCVGDAVLAVPESGELRQRVVLRTGARLLLRTSATSAPVSVCLYPIGWQGDPRGCDPLSFTDPSGSGGNIILRPGTEYRSERPLPPGIWQVGATIPVNNTVDFRTMVRAGQVSLGPGQTTELALTLEPRGE